MNCNKTRFRVIKINCYWVNPTSKVFELVESLLGYDGGDLRGNNAKQDANDARYVAVCCIKKLIPSISMIELGKLFKRSRASTYRIMAIIKSFTKTDKQFQQKLNLISQQIFCSPCFYSNQ